MKLMLLYKGVSVKEMEYQPVYMGADDWLKIEIDDVVNLAIMRSDAATSRTKTVQELYDELERDREAHAAFAKAFGFDEEKP